MLLFAALSGGLVMLFTVLADSASEFFSAMQGQAPWVPLILTPLVAALVVWAVRRFAPGASGSGVPHVIAALDSKTPLAGRSHFVSFKLSIAKILAVSVGLLGGLSIGRQGPSVQIASGMMYQARRWLSPQSGIGTRDLMMAGGAAGLAAAFNTPLGGIVFAVEEMWRRPEDRSSGLMLSAIIVSGLVAVSAFGNLSYFGRVRVEQIAWWELIVPGTVTAVACGLLGGLFSRLLIACFTGLPDVFCAFKRRWPVWFAACCGLIVAGIGILSQGEVFGGGHHHTLQLLAATETGTAAPGPQTPFMLTWLKFLATWFSVWSGAPGGLFTPCLSIGASLGADIASVMNSPHAAALIALGMAGFVAAVSPAPITAMIIVMEMTDGHSLVLSLMAAALVANLVSRVISPPLFATMAELMVRERWPPSGAPAETAKKRSPGAPDFKDQAAGSKDKTAAPESLDAPLGAAKRAAEPHDPTSSTASASTAASAPSGRTGAGAAAGIDQLDVRKQGQGPRAESPLAGVAPAAEPPLPAANDQKDDEKTARPRAEKNARREPD
ncbi:MAG: chloride channel protein [Burkholderiales bacterium]